MSARSRLLAAAALVAISRLVVISPAPAVLRLPAALLLCFVLPGWAVLRLVRLDPALGTVERALVALGGSCAVLVVLAVAIGVSPVPLTATVFATVLEALLLAVLAGLWLRTPDDRAAVFRVPVEELRPAALTSRLWPAGAGAGRRLRPAAAHVAWLVAASLVVGSVWIATAASDASSGPVELWMLRQGAGATVGIYNGTSQKQTYVLSVGPQFHRPNGITVEVGAGQRWQESITFPASWSLPDVIVAALYRPQDLTPFRTTSLPVGAAASG